MQPDPNTVNRLLSQNDERLWSAIRMIASQNGVSLPSATPPAEDMRRLRDAIGGITDDDVGNAVRIVNEMRRRGEKHHE